MITNSELVLKALVHGLEVSLRDGIYVLAKDHVGRPRINITTRVERALGKPIKSRDVSFNRFLREAEAIDESSAATLRELFAIEDERMSVLGGSSTPINDRLPR